MAYFGFSVVLSHHFDFLLSEAPPPPLFFVYFSLDLYTFWASWALLASLPSDQAFQRRVLAACGCIIANDLILASGSCWICIQHGCFFWCFCDWTILT